MKDVVKEIEFGWICTHCPNNPTAERPYIKVAIPELDKKTVGTVQQKAKEDLKDPNCWLCHLLREFSKVLEVL